MGLVAEEKPESRGIAADLALQCSDIAMQYVVGRQAGPVVAINASVPNEARQPRVAHPVQFFHAAEARHVKSSLLHPPELFRFGGRIAPCHYGEFLWCYGGGWVEFLRGGNGPQGCECEQAHDPIMNRVPLL